MPVVVKVIEQLNDEMVALRVMLHKLVQDVDFQPRGFSILGDVLDDLQRQLTVPSLCVLQNKGFIIFIRFRP